ncbi:hypothetical protein ABFX02_07G006000 [Erythranthe guttata]
MEMEAFDDDDFSDLYADVEVQASSAIRAFNGLTKMPPPDVTILDDATGGEKGEGYSFSGAEIPEGNGEIYDRATVGEVCGGLTELPLDNGLSENNANDGNKQKSDDSDCISLRKKRKVDDVAHQVHKLGNSADADVDDGRDICFSRASEDNLPDFVRNDGGDKVASARGSKHTHAWDSMPSDSDKHGSLQVFDSEGDNHHEVSDCDSDGMLEKADIANRRNASSSSDEAPLLAELESSQSGWSHHSPGSSSPSSVSAALSNDDNEKDHKHSKNTRDYHPSNNYRSHTLKSCIEDGRYRQRQRSPVRKELNNRKEYSDMPDLKSHLTDEDCSYANYVERNRHISHGRRREVLSFNSKRKDMPYYNRSESFSTQFGGTLPDYHSGPPYLENQNWNIRPSYRYKHDGHYMRDKQDYIEKRSSKMDYEATEDNNWYHKQRRHVVHSNMEVSRKFLPNYHSSAVNMSDTQFRNKGDEVHFRRTKRHYLSPLRDYNNDAKEKSRRFIRDYPDHRYGQNIDRQRRETERSVSGNRRRDNPHISSDNLWYKEGEDNGRRCVKQRHLPFYSHLVENQHVRNKHYLQSTDTYITNESIKDHFVRRRHQTEALHSREDVYKSWQQDNTIFHSERPSYHYPKKSKNDRLGDRHAFGRVAEVIGEREVGSRQRFNNIREGDSRNQFDGCLKFIEADKCVQMHRKYQYSVDSRLVVVDKKRTTPQSSRRASEDGDDFNCHKNDLTESNANQNPGNLEDLGDFKLEKAASISTDERKVKTTNLSDKNWQDKFSENPKNECLDVEEGQIIGEESNGHTVKSASNGTAAVVESLGDEKIQEIMAKMERRRERFKEQITLSRDSAKSSNLASETAFEGKLERPARKRRWF